MALSISREALDLIANSENSLILGIITAEKVVKLRVADATYVPGHLDWLQEEPIAEVVRGFSLLVKHGTVDALFPASRLNPGQDAKLEFGLITELEALLPLGSGFRVLGY